ncbi:hypothetical protein AB0C10_29565 [Microbispora amethystogenes]|uniref:hypothetical protein n=1 Tax=Microbispora amethystogenes TaxID=1427754 RepID=UPI00340DDFD8
MQSDEGRLWATRERPFTPAAESAGAYRTVDADDVIELVKAIATQEACADMTALL